MSRRLRGVLLEYREAILFSSPYLTEELGAVRSRLGLSGDLHATVRSHFPEAPAEVSLPNGEEGTFEDHVLPEFVEQEEWLWRKSLQFQAEIERLMVRYRHYDPEFFLELLLYGSLLGWDDDPLQRWEMYDEVPLVVGAGSDAEGEGAQPPPVTAIRQALDQIERRKVIEFETEPAPPDLTNPIGGRERIKEWLALLEDSRLDVLRIVIRPSTRREDVLGLWDTEDLSGAARKRRTLQQALRLQSQTGETSTPSIESVPAVGDIEKEAGTKPITHLALRLHRETTRQGVKTIWPEVRKLQRKLVGDPGERDRARLQLERDLELYLKVNWASGTVTDEQVTRAIEELREEQAKRGETPRLIYRETARRALKRLDEEMKPQELSVLD